VQNSFVPIAYEALLHCMPGSAYSDTYTAPTAIALGKRLNKLGLTFFIFLESFSICDPKCFLCRPLV